MRKLFNTIKQNEESRNNTIILQIDVDDAKKWVGSTGTA